MYAFSVNGTASGDQHGVASGASVFFIVYINFEDLLGAEHLCKLYLMQAGFREIAIVKRKKLDKAVLANDQALAADKHLKDAVTSGYAIQMFEQ